MRKLLSILLSVLMVMGICTFPAYADTSPAIYVGSVSGRTGDTVFVPVSLRSNTGFANISIEIYYDSAALELKSPVNNNGVGATFTKSETVQTMPYVMTWDCTSNNSYNGNLVFLPFEIITEDIENYPIKVSFYKGRNGDYTDGESVNYDENFASLGLKYYSGMINTLGKPQEEAPGITLGSTSGINGETIAVPVMLSGNRGFSNISIEVGYDDSMLKLTQVLIPAEVHATVSNAQSYNKNPYNISWDNPSNNPYNGTIGMLLFKIITDLQGELPLTVDYYKGRNGDYTDGVSVNYDEDFNPLGLKYVDGVVGLNISEEHSVSVDSNLGLTLTGDITKGKIHAALMRDGRLIEYKIFTPKDGMYIEFNSPNYGDNVTVMWLEDNLRPLCPAEKVTLR